MSELPSEQIDDIIARQPGWKGDLMARLRTLIRQADPEAREAVKWKKPSRPEGVAVWTHDGNVCLAEALKNTVRLTFPNGALIADSDRLFNARLDSTSVRAIDFGEGSDLNEPALKALIIKAAAANKG